IGLREDCLSSGLFCQDCEFDAVIRIAIHPIDWLVAPTLVRTDVRRRESRCHPLKFETMCWGPDIEAVHRVNQDRLRALAQQMWNSNRVPRALAISFERPISAPARAGSLLQAIPAPRSACFPERSLPSIRKSQCTALPPPLATRRQFFARSIVNSRICT